MKKSVIQMGSEVFVWLNYLKIEYRSDIQITVLNQGQNSNQFVSVTSL